MDKSMSDTKKTINDTDTVEMEAANYERLPLLALRGLCAFPGILLNFDIERDISTLAIDAAHSQGRRVFLVAQKDIMKESPKPSDLYTIGTICQIKQMLKMPGGGIKALVDGVSRARIITTEIENGYYVAEVEPIVEPAAAKKSAKTEALMRRCVGMFDTYASLSAVVSRELIFPLFTMSEPGRIADYIVQHMMLRHDKKQPVLEAIRPLRRLELVSELLAHELEIQGIEQEIDENIRMRLEGQHREHILREQLHAIQMELGDDRGETADDITIYRRKIAELAAPQEVVDKLYKEVDKLDKLHFGSAEASVISSYLDICLELPWSRETKERRDIDHARRVLDDDHFGLDKVKERIIELLSVKQMNPDHRGTIICLIGPPGVGKTSVAISIARATGRKLARLSLGGIHDEAEVRGHRKTYVGAMPGRIIEAINRVGTRNPLMLLDEIDKLGSDYRGDPAAALLEALDPEQNTTFRDHFLELPFDLSNTMFITTANTASTIPQPLLDRMEIIEMSSYTDMEKLEIAKRHLFPKQRKKHGLNGRQIKLSDTAMLEMIAGWTRESGVRQLEREIAALCRKTTTKLVRGECKSVSVTPESLPELLGARKFTRESELLAGEIGVVRGLAWTSAGGTTLDVEVNVLPGKGNLKLTGNLGDTMKESAEAAVSYIRSRAERLNISPDFYTEKDIHIHFPEGGIPKDGPSAGITMCIAVISALTGTPVREGVVMTGEITLRGRVLRIGGLKEKTMAALRAGAKTVIIPADNESDLEEIDQTVRRSLRFVTARHIDAVLDVALDFSAVGAATQDITADSQKTKKAPNAPRVRQ